MSIQSSLRGTATQPRLRRRPITDWTSPLPSSRGALATKQPRGRVMLPLGCFAALAMTGTPREPPVTTDEAAPENGPAEPAAEYIVGYGRPPVAFRFRPGRSGN